MGSDDWCYITTEAVSDETASVVICMYWLVDEHCCAEGLDVGVGG